MNSIAWQTSSISASPPGMILYFWQLNGLRNIGWIAAILFAVSGALRLARFNVSVDDGSKPAFAANFFTGVPIPAGAITVLLPVYLSFLGLPPSPVGVTAIYTVLIALLMISRVPVFSGKSVHVWIPRPLVIPLLISAIVLTSLSVSYRWYVLSAGSLLYLASLPIGWKIFKIQLRNAATTATAPTDVMSKPAQAPVPATAFGRDDW